MGYIGQTPSAVPLDGSDIADDIIDSQHYVDGSVDLAHMSSQSVDEDNIHISNAGTNGQFLSKQSGDAGGLTWADAGVTGLTNSSNTTWMTVSADEEVNLPLQPAFLGRSSNVTNVTGNGTTYTVIWATESYDIGGNFSTSTFTAPITGKYLICSSVHITAMTGTPTAIGSNIVTSNNTYGNYFNNANGVLVSGTTRTVKNTVVADMDSGDTATVTIRVMGQDAGDDVDMTTGNGYDYLTVTLIA